MPDSLPICRNTDRGVGIQLSPDRFLPITQIICIGRNYAEHAREQGLAPPDSLVIFTKNLATLALHDEPIRLPRICDDREQIDYEGELAVLIGDAPRGLPARDIPEQQALNFVAGYTCANDVSARWWQKQGSGGQFYRGKSFDTFCPIGPALVPPRQLGNPDDLRLTTRLNGQTVQNASTGEMTWSVPRLIAELSRDTTLLPGTLILTGTPSGVGTSRTPPVFLRDGDVVEVEIQGIGTLRNPVRQADPAAG